MGFLYFVCFCQYGHCWYFHNCCCITKVEMTTRFGYSDLFDFDHEVERTLHACRRVNQASTSTPVSYSDSDYVFSNNLFDYDFEFNYHNMDEQTTLRELDALDVNYNAFCSILKLLHLLN